MKMKISKIEKQQSIQKVLEIFFKASRPVTELSKNPFLPCFSIHHIFHHSPIKNVGSSQFSFSCRKLLEYLEYLKVASGPFPNLLISVLEYTHSPPFIKLLKTLLNNLQTCKELPKTIPSLLFNRPPHLYPAFHL